MTSSNDRIVELVMECLGSRGEVKARRMFGGHGLYFDGVFFALLADGVGYFKTTDDDRSAYDAEGCGPFVYESKRGAATLKSYYAIPERLFDEPDELAEWALRAISAAQAAARDKPKRRPPMSVAASVKRRS